jgi:hypothetical protein
MLVFYERFIEIKPLEDEIHDLQISDEEKENLKFMSAEIFHHHALETILDSLETEDRKKFLKAVESHEEMNLAQLLKDKIEDYEKILKDKLEKVRDDIIEEIKKVKK